MELLLGFPCYYSLYACASDNSVFSARTAKKKKKKKKKKSGRAECKWEGKTGQETQLYSKKDFFTEREKKEKRRRKIKKTRKTNKNKNKTQKQQKTSTTRTRKKKRETDELLMFTVGKDSALFSGLRKLEVARPSDSNVRALLSVRLSFGEYPLVGI